MIVFAKLLIGGKNYGVHAFLVEIRNIHGSVLTGMTVGDCGAKFGLNGVDNGWCIFNNFKVPYDSLLDKYSSIDEKGEFHSIAKKKSVRFAMQLSAISDGRMMVAFTACIGAFSSAGMTLRYLSVRKQFGV